METYVLDFGSFALENWWQVGLAFSAAVLYVLYGLIPFVCIVARPLFKPDTEYYETILACCALIPFIGIISGIIFWEKSEWMLKVAALLIVVLSVCFVGCILSSAGII